MTNLTPTPSLDDVFQLETDTLVLVGSIRGGCIFV